MTEDQETAAARIVHTQAHGWAHAYDGKRDEDAATVAILVRALELATPGWSVLGRASLFTTGDE